MRGVRFAAYSSPGSSSSTSVNTNQDRFGIVANLPKFAVACVADGHGEHGALLAEMACKELICAASAACGRKESPEMIASFAMLHASGTIDKMPEAFDSGVTIAAAILSPENGHIIVASVGDDCEVMLLSQNSEDDNVFCTLTQKKKKIVVDHKKYRSRFESRADKRKRQISTTEASTTIDCTSEASKPQTLGDVSRKTIECAIAPFIKVVDFPARGGLLLLGTKGIWGDPSSENEISSYDVIGQCLVGCIQSPAVAVKKVQKIVGRPMDDATCIGIRLEKADVS